MSPAEQRSREKNAINPKRLNPKPPRVERKTIFDCQMKQMRANLNLTIEDLRLGTGLTDFAIFEIERGTNPTLRTAFKIANYFGVRVEDMWSMKVTPPQAETDTVD